MNDKNENVSFHYHIKDTYGNTIIEIYSEDGHLFGVHYPAWENDTEYGEVYAPMRSWAVSMILYTYDKGECRKFQKKLKKFRENHPSSYNVLDAMEEDGIAEVVPIDEYEQ